MQDIEQKTKIFNQNPFKQRQKQTKMKTLPIQEIQAILKEAEHPLFIFDDDPDGLCAYLLLQRYMNMNKPSFIIARGGVGLDEQQRRKAEEEKPDLIILLDASRIDKEAETKIKTKIIWIDHHPLQKVERIHYYNNNNYSKDYHSTTWMVSQITKQKDWLATLGCIFDFHLPEYFKETVKQYPDLLQETNNVEDVLYKMPFKELIDIYYFSLKGEAKEVKKAIRCLEKIQTPHDILYETIEEGSFVKKRTEKFQKDYQKLLKEAEDQVTKDPLISIILQEQRTSMSGKLAGELTYKYPNKFIICGREKDGVIRMSLRSRKYKVRDIVGKALVTIKGTGGGHAQACGAVISKEDFPQFLENIKQQLI